MRTSIITLLAKQVIKEAFTNKAVLALSGILLLLLATGIKDIPLPI